MIKQGDRVPEAKLTRLTDDGIVEVSTSDFFKGRRVVLFAVPGAFTPTCSNRHLPGFIERAAEIKSKGGVDEIACVSVNDAFVMNAWGKASLADGKVTLLADGDCGFTRKLGLELDTGGKMGLRSRRYAMVVEDGTVAKLWVEEPGEFKFSSAEHVLSEL